jgi:hypothetical protein
MSSRRAGEHSSPLLSGSRLAVLDEFRVPYSIEPTSAVHDWACLQAGGGKRALHWKIAPNAQPRMSFAGDIPILAAVVPDSAVEEFAANLPGEWAPGLPIRDEHGAKLSSIWRSPDGGSILPFDPNEAILALRSERYLALCRGRTTSLSFARHVYYRLRPLLPRRLQIALRRGFVRVQEGASFPRWPTETALHDLAELLLGLVARAAGQPLPIIAPWPNGHLWALVLTHDVETARGLDTIDDVRALELECGYRSSWNLVPERYTVTDELVRGLMESGFEVGVHGLRHDGRDLESRRTLEQRLPEMRRWADRWGADGFRAPATHRVWEWMPLLGFDYDSSYPDTDPYEPIAGGCCSWLPFFNETLVELPITLPQDHTLFVVLRRSDGMWHEKAEFLRKRGGMALLITHPDYLVGEERLFAYRRFLLAYADDATAWKALPREVSAWWRARSETTLHLVDGEWKLFGPAAREASIAWVSPTAVPPARKELAHAV